MHPNKLRYKKVFGPHGVIGYDRKVVVPEYGAYGLCVVESGYLSEREVVAVWRFLRKKFKRMGKVLVCVYPNKSLTSKPSGMRMGKGKGTHDTWVSEVKSGRLLYEFENIGIQGKYIRGVFDEASLRLSLKTRVVRLRW